jgi:hypothetical protein
MPKPWEGDFSPFILLFFLIWYYKVTGTFESFSLQTRFLQGRDWQDVVYLDGIYFPIEYSGFLIELCVRNSKGSYASALFMFTVLAPLTIATSYFRQSRGVVACSFTQPAQSAQLSSMGCSRRDRSSWLQILFLAKNLLLQQLTLLT